MICPKCKCEMSVIKGYNVIENDNTPDKETKLYRVLVNKCTNKNCSNDEEVLERVELDIGG